MTYLTEEQSQQVEEALKDGAEFGVWPISKNCEEALATIRAARAQEQKPVSREPIGKATVNVNGTVEIELFATSTNLDIGKHELYATPMCTKDLTDDEIAECFVAGDEIASGRAIITKFKEKNK